MSNESKMKWNKEHLERALSVSSDGVIWISKKGRIEKANRAFVRLSGLSKKNLKKASLFNLCTDFSKKDWKRIWKILKESKTKSIETIISNKNKRIPIELNLSFVENKRENLAFVLVRDISIQHGLKTELKQANYLLGKIVDERSEESKRTLNALITRKQVLEKLQDLQRQHESILQSAGEGIYGLDTRGFTTFANSAAVDMVGWSLEEMIGKSQHDLIHHTKIDGSPFNKKKCSIYAAFSDGKIHHEENEVFWRKDGTSFPVEYISTPIRDQENQLIGAVVSFKDITRRKEAELALTLSNLELKQWR